MPFIRQIKVSPNTADTKRAGSGHEGARVWRARVCGPGPASRARPLPRGGSPPAPAPALGGSVLHARWLQTRGPASAGRLYAYHPQGPGRVVVLQRHLQPVVLRSIFVHFAAGLIHLLPGGRGHRFLGVVPRGVVLIFLLVLVVPLPGLLPVCRDGPRVSPAGARQEPGSLRTARRLRGAFPAPRAQPRASGRGRPPREAPHPARSRRRQGSPGPGVRRGRGVRARATAHRGRPGPSCPWRRRRHCGPLARPPEDFRLTPGALPAASPEVPPQGAGGRWRSERGGGGATVRVRRAGRAPGPPSGPAAGVCGAPAVIDRAPL